MTAFDHNMQNHLVREWCLAPEARFTNAFILNDSRGTKEVKGPAFDSLCKSHLPNLKRNLD
jgi:hypothetical protein